MANSAMVGSIMRDLEYEIYMRIVIERYSSMSDIQRYFPDDSKRTLIRKVQNLCEIGKISHERIHGKGKRKLYYVKEESPKQDVTVRSFEEGSYIEIRPTITQR